MELCWLMIQRARNFAGISPELRPPAVFLLKHDDAQLDFWQGKPAGITPLICTNWDDGWEQILEWAEKINSTLGLQ